MSFDPAAPAWGVSRRSFVKAGIAAMAAAQVGPVLLHAEDKAAEKPIILGKDAYAYEIVTGWGALPEGKRYGYTHGVCETADGRIFIHNQSPTGDVTCEFDPEGKFIKSWGKEFGGTGENFWKTAHGMQLRKEENEEFLYLAPTGLHKVFKTTLEGEIVLKIDYPKDAKNAKGELCYKDEGAYVPTNIAFAPTGGDFYVADGYGSNYIHQYNAKGEYIRTWGGSGNADGQLNCPHGIWCDTRGKDPLLVVADRSNVRLQWFTLDGKYASKVTDELRHPCHFDQRGTDLLIPDLQGRVTIFDKDNKLITHLGDEPDPKRRGIPMLPDDQRVTGRFVSPHQAIWDKAGNIYVVEWQQDGRITKLRHVS